MKKDEGFHEYVMAEIFREIDGITSRAMFGGWGIYKDSLFFALIADGQLYFKVDSSNQADFEKSGSKQFTYQMRVGRETRLNFWELPVDIYDDLDQLNIWVEKSVAVAAGAKKK